MNLTNVKLIFAREVRDQLRDRRTLFMIFVLPVLLYPLLGTAYFQMVQFRTQKAMNVLVVGSGQLGSGQANDMPAPLIEGDRFSTALFPDAEQGAELLKLQIAGDSQADVEADATRAVQEKSCDAALIFPADFAQRLAAYRKAINVSGTLRVPLAGGTRSVPDTIPRPKIVYTTANERSLMAYNRLTGVLDRWTEEIGKANLVAGGLPTEAVRPFEVESANLAGDEPAPRSVGLWSRLLPFMLLLWALTGAFYPAIDLCAGEKERGTLETLLSSPAQRSEIVLGKLFTIIAFSATTAALNLACTGFTGTMIFRHVDGLGGPPALAVVWMALALPPVAALFSALCLALASFARSTKEGQYYLMPLLMLSLPLAMLPMMPGVELSLGNSLLPVAGLTLLLKTLLEGSYLQALQYAPIVLAVTLAACWLAVRWAVAQFNSESVLFRESERFDLRLWLVSLWRDRTPTPSAAAGLTCGVLILVLSFHFRAAVAPPQNFDGFARVTLLLQAVAVLAPALLMALALTRSPRQTLLLNAPRWPMLAAAGVLAVALHPFIVGLNALVMWLYPLAPQMEQMANDLQQKFTSANIWLLLLCVAAAPAICEEMAFRGFILSGCRKLGNRRGVIVSAIFFGVAHGFLQQEINAAVLGLILGFLAVRSESLLPGVVFHFLHNGLTVLSGKVTPELLERFPALGLFVQPTRQGAAYQWPIYLLCGAASVAIIFWLARSSRPRQADAPAAPFSAIRCEGAA